MQRDSSVAARRLPDLGVSLDNISVSDCSISPSTVEDGQMMEVVFDVNNYHDTNVRVDFEVVGDGVVLWSDSIWVGDYGTTQIRRTWWYSSLVNKFGLGDTTISVRAVDVSAA